MRDVEEVVAIENDLLASSRLDSFRRQSETRKGSLKEMGVAAQAVEWNGVEGKGQIDVFTAQGQPVATRTLGSQTRTTFSTQHCAQGMYTVRLQTRRGTQTWKVLKQ